MKPLSFTKMHSLGNDFMVIDGVQQEVSLSAARIRQLSDRHRGVGFDQLLLVEPARTTGTDFFYRIFNASGGEVGQCGNGARCLAQFLKWRGLTQQTRFILETQTTRLSVALHDQEEVSVTFAPPRFAPSEIPTLGPIRQGQIQVPLFSDKIVALYPLNVGNPQVVWSVTDWSEVDVGSWGRQMSEHAYFPEQTNVVFMQVLAPDQLKIRVYERGCGETSACGSAAVAAFVIATRYFSVQTHKVSVHLPGGVLYLSEDHHRVTLRGPVTRVYEGQLL